MAPLTFYKDRSEYFLDLGTLLFFETDGKRICGHTRNEAYEVKHEVDLGIQRLKDLGLNPIFLPHSLKGLDFIKEHPEARAEDLIHAFSDDSIDMILCAIGGDDTYRLLPYLFENDQLQKVIKPKIFLGFSDTTMNHLMLHKLGVKTFYGQSFLADICELDKEMLLHFLKTF